MHKALHVAAVTSASVNMLEGECPPMAQLLTRCFLTDQNVEDESLLNKSGAARNQYCI